MEIDNLELSDQDHIDKIFEPKNHEPQKKVNSNT